MTKDDWIFLNNYGKASTLAACFSCQYRNEENKCLLASMQCYDIQSLSRTEVYVEPNCICDKYFGDAMSTTYAQDLQDAGVFDSVQETLEHKRLVLRFIEMLITLIKARGETHDDSKLLEPERSIFTIFSRKLINNKYGDADYERNKRMMKTALQHHYDRNSHHPEHYPDGVNNMDLVDIIEMLCDWKAASMRHQDGDITRSIEKCSERFKIDDQLKNILLNTAERYLK